MAIDSDYVKQMSTQLATYEVQSSLDRLNRNESNYQAQRDALSKLRTSLTTFKSAVAGLKTGKATMLVNSASFSQEATPRPRSAARRSRAATSSMSNSWPASSRSPCRGWSMAA
ncbi:flagellar hook-associated 2 domain-containing protein [Pseudomonas sp. BAY1663]|nr:flagellar hook-associated 2 domain-containing protein [Pseudomonas sp. BAY1663]